jgi:hypothetical protein
MMLEDCIMICIIDVMHRSKRILSPDDLVLVSYSDLFRMCCTFRVNYTHNVVTGFRFTYYPI